MLFRACPKRRGPGNKGGVPRDGVNLVEGHKPILLEKELIKWCRFCKIPIIRG